MISRKVIAALAFGLVLLVATFAVPSPASAAVAPVEPEQAPMGPWIDEIVWSEEGDRSKALTEIIAGNRDTIMFDITAIADRERALASSEVGTFSAYGFIDQFNMNPVEQKAIHPRNPFAVREVREAMQILIDRNFVVREIYGGFAIPWVTLWHPRSADYGRAINDLIKLEDKYAFDPDEGRGRIFAALLARNWTIGTDGKWHDPDNKLVTIKILKRTQDERILLGGYYGNVLRGLNFDVQEIPVTGATVARAGPPDENQWHIYTAGFIATTLEAWDDDQIYFWSGNGCRAQQGIICQAGFYTAPQELLDIGDTLAFGRYKSLTERGDLIRRGTELAMQEANGFFVDARQSIYAYNNRLQGAIWDLFGGPTNVWALKAATVPAVDPDGSGPLPATRTARILNLLMFVDGWNPWQAAAGWLYDTVQRRAMIDEPMFPHPHTGRWIDIRNTASVVTAGPDSNLTMPSDAVVFNVTSSAWDQVGTGKLARSKVTLDFAFGKWHHGPAISMDDVLYDISNGYRRSFGDISQTPGLLNTASDATKQFYDSGPDGILRGIKVIDADTLEVWVNYWHVDTQEIAATGSFFPMMPWEAAEVGVAAIKAEQVANNEGDSKGTGRVWLDFTKGDSLPFLRAHFDNLARVSHIPPGLGAFINATEATERWGALGNWSTTTTTVNQLGGYTGGHFWPSNGPFWLEKVDVINRQTIMKAFRTGYPWDANYWKTPGRDLVTIAAPVVAFAPTPPVVFAGTPAIFDYSVSVGPSPTDDISARYFLRDVTTGAFIREGAPTRLGTGSYRIEIPAAETDQLLLGNFEVITVVNSNNYAVPSIQRSAFLILPSTEWFRALLDARATIIENEVSDLSGDVGQMRSDLNSLSSSTAGLVALVTALTILAVIAVVVSVVSVVLVLRRARGPPAAKPLEEPPEL